MGSSSEIQSDIDLSSSFMDRVKASEAAHSIGVGLHRAHVWSNGIHEGTSHIVGDVAGIGGGAVGLVVDAADIGSEWIGYDLYTEGSAMRDFFSGTRDWTKENVGTRVASVLIMPSTVADLIAGGKAEILPETDQTIYSIAENGTRVVGDVAIVVGALVLSGGTIAALAPAAKTVAVGAVGVTKTSYKLAPVLVVGDQLLTDGWGANAFLTTVKKGSEMVGSEKGANILDVAANWAGPDYFDSKEDPDASLGDLLAAVRKKKIPPGEESGGNLLRDLAEYLPEGMEDGLKVAFNWLAGDGGIWSMAAIGITALVGGNLLLDKMMGNSLLSGFLSIGLAIVAMKVLPKLFGDAAKSDESIATPVEDTVVENQETALTDLTALPAPAF